MKKRDGMNEGDEERTDKVNVKERDGVNEGDEEEKEEAKEDGGKERRTWTKELKKEGRTKPA